MNMAEYLTELKNVLNKINRQTWTELKMIEANTNVDLHKVIGPEETETLEKAKNALTLVTDILGNI